MKYTNTYGSKETTLLGCLNSVAEAEDRGWSHHKIMNEDGTVVYDSKNPVKLILRCDDENILKRQSWHSEPVRMEGNDRVFKDLGSEYQWHVKHGKPGKRVCHIEADGTIVTTISTPECD